MNSPTGLQEILARDAPDGRRGHVANRLRPFGRVRLHVRDELGERGLAFEPAFGEHVAVRADLERHVRLLRFERAGDDRLPVARIAQVVAVRADEIRRGGVAIEEFQVQRLRGSSCSSTWIEGVEERGIGLRLDRHPLAEQAPVTDRCGSTCTRFMPRRARSRGARPGHPARGLDVRPAGDQVVGERRVGRDGEAAVPQLAVEVLGVVALHSLARAEAHVHRTPRGEESGEAPHVELRRAAAAEARRDARIAGLVEQGLFSISFNFS